MLGILLKSFALGCIINCAFLWCIINPLLTSLAGAVSVLYLERLRLSDKLGRMSSFDKGVYMFSYSLVMGVLFAYTNVLLRYFTQKHSTLWLNKDILYSVLPEYLFFDWDKIIFLCLFVVIFVSTFLGMLVVFRLSIGKKFHREEEKLMSQMNMVELQTYLRDDQ